ncbi:LapA family protein [Fictibacillus barbaricus]|uniref:Integral membrane protein n=1 Tax=Fictibacillus barbaricus TaxID=182136 RepID=A0ABU1TX22_9BACL|nr:lipopolysaccharide assembly protein LapA domain-containing protein [Fictibacillus barbaricus]MDR7071777.1 putative integral membrane protein [Fictibacillus barbaricus]
MKMQLYLIFGFIFTLVIATFAVINGGDVEINYLFGTAKWPLVLVILGSAGIGGLTVGLFSLMKIIQLQRQIRKLHGLHNERADLRHDDQTVVVNERRNDTESVGSRVEERQH